MDKHKILFKYKSNSSTQLKVANFKFAQPSLVCLRFHFPGQVGVGGKYLLILVKQGPFKRVRGGKWSPGILSAMDDPKEEGNPPEEYFSVSEISLSLFGH